VWRRRSWTVDPRVRVEPRRGVAEAVFRSERRSKG
jgi:hypothetical protein